MPRVLDQINTVNAYLKFSRDLLNLPKVPQNSEPRGSLEFQELLRERTWHNITLVIRRKSDRTAWMYVIWLKRWEDFFPESNPDKCLQTDLFYAFGKHNVKHRYNKCVWHRYSSCFFCAGTTFEKWQEVWGQLSNLHYGIPLLNIY